MFQKERLISLSVSAPEARGNFSFEEWMETDYLLFYPEGHAIAKSEPIALETIATHPLILLERGTADRQHIEHTFEKENLRINVVFETSSYTLNQRSRPERGGHRSRQRALAPTRILPISGELPTYPIFSGKSASACSGETTSTSPLTPTIISPC